MTVLVTGCAGFIGFHVSEALLRRGEPVIGIDNLNDYYDVELKNARLDRLRRHDSFGFFQVNIADRTAIMALADRLADVTTVLHLAGQAGVRYSLENPYAFVEANLMGQVVLLELTRKLPRLRQFVYASTSSVYGDRREGGFSPDLPADEPVSLYAATKRSGEIITETYHRLYGTPVTALRFFTVYGPWGRPDMAYYSFVKAAFAGTPVPLFNGGAMQRDFTYIDDLVIGVLGAIDRQPTKGTAIYNLGNSRSEALLNFVRVIEQATGHKLKTIDKPMQKGDVHATFADIASSRRDLGFDPRTPIEAGIPRFVKWFREYHGV